MPNYILIGMPSSGKTTKGKRIAKALDLKFIDTDKMIQNACKSTPAQIVKKNGRDAFLEVQNEIVVSHNYNDMVISTGGGIIYSKKAMMKLKDMGTVIFLDVPFEVLQKRIDPNRSLSSSNGKGLKDIFDERRPIYKSFADIHIICDNKEADEIVEEIIYKIKLENQ